MRKVFNNRDSVSTEELLSALNAMDESPWGNLRGAELDSRGLAGRLRKYGVKPKNVRIGEHVVKGYDKADLWDVWERYIPSLPIESATGATSATNAGFD